MAATRLPNSSQSMGKDTNVSHCGGPSWLLMSARCKGVSRQSANKDGFGIIELGGMYGTAIRIRSAPANTRKLLLTHIAIAIGRVIFCFGWGRSPLLS